MAMVDLELLSAREAEVLNALRDHLTNAEIARRLHISVRTVESHVSSLLRKLGAADRRGLAALAGEVAAQAPLGPGEIVGVPTKWTSFVGRATELAELSEAISTSRLVTIVGPGGVGKTRLAAAAAGLGTIEFPAGGAFVDLVPVRPEFIVEAVAAALGVVEHPQEPLEKLVHRSLCPGRRLLVLDSCEHVIGAAAAFAASALASCPQLVVLTTSRERLGIIGERIVELGPLGLTPVGAHVSDAEALFADRAGLTASLDFGSLDGGSPLIAQICNRLEGMPLAIELAAARTSSLGLDGLLAGLDDHLRVLSRAGIPGDRHGSMRTVIDWSHQLLDGEERAMFRRLGVFAGPFDLHAAATVASAREVAVATDLIGRLADKSLLARVQEGTTSRWRMLDTVRAFAAEELEASGEAAELHRHHLAWAASVARDIEQRLDTDREWQERFDSVSDDLRAALQGTPLGAGEAADAGADFELALALGHISYARRFLVEARDHVDEAVARAPDEGAAVTALRFAADLAFAEMRGEAAFSLLETGSARAFGAGDTRSAAITLAAAAAIGGRCPGLFSQPLRHDELAALIDRAQALHVPEGPEDLEVEAYIAVAAAWDCSRAPAVPDRDRAKEALVVAERLGDPVLISSALDANCGAVAEDNEFKEALRFTAQRLALLDQLPRNEPRTGGEVADIFHMATESALAAGDLQLALTSAHMSYYDSTSQGLPHFVANHLVIPLALQGDFDGAVRQAQVMREGWERAGSPAAGWMAPSFFASALVHGLRGDQKAYAEFWDLAMTIRMRSTVNSFGLFVEPRVALHLGALDRARSTAAVDEQDMCGSFGPYARAVSVEIAVVTGAADAEERLASAAFLSRENDFVAAHLLRAAGRLRGDEALLKESVDAWGSIGARFERACTMLLLPTCAEEGAAELMALGCPRPLY
jgi:predicted ATPase/DNA-binding CsgD family transcriptional regulator